MQAYGERPFPAGIACFRRLLGKLRAGRIHPEMLAGFPERWSRMLGPLLD
jgi:hypothetical protein